MKEARLLPSQRNRVFEVVAASTDFHPSEFRLEQFEDLTFEKATTHQLVHKKSGLYFTFGNASEEKRWSVFSPGQSTPTQSFTVISFERQLKLIPLWLSYLKRELDAPDLWGAISQQSDLIAAAAGESNAKFTAAEKKYILEGITEIKQYLLTAHRLDPELVEARLNYLVEASDRLGRKDFINVLVGTVISIITAAVLPPETTREIFIFVGTVLAEILKNRGPLLLP